MVQDKHNLAYDVAKSGLTSGWTTGTIDAIASILNLCKDWESVVPIEIRQEPEAQDVQLGPTGKWPKKAVKNYHRPVLVVGIVPTDYYNGKILIESGDSGSVDLLKELNDDSWSRRISSNSEAGHLQLGRSSRWRMLQRAKWQAAMRKALIVKGIDEQRLKCQHGERRHV
jgi:hypothetical protein